MNKKEFIHQLKSVKLVLGNGFDLHCDLRTSFKHYYIYNYERIDIIKKWYEEFDRYFKKKQVPLVDTSQNVELFNNTSLWDFFFVILCIERNNSDFEGYLWCQVEEDIANALKDVKHAKNEAELIDSVSTQLSTPINLDFVYEEMTAVSKSYDSPVCAFAHVVDHKSNHSIYSKEDFYSFLLNELKLFENEFVKFLKWQLAETIYHSFGIVTPNHTYFMKAVATINEICGFDNLVSIDSFNYTYIEDDRVKQIIHYINSDIENPIFGVDSVFQTDDPKFIFTKTSRRMANDTVSKNVDNREKYEHVIIYGHSLNEADYSYFFPIFDEIDLANNKSTSKIVFAYSIFEESKRAERIKEINDSVFRIIEKYAVERNMLFSNRFLDSLTTRGRVILYEIPLIDETKYEKSIFDDKWKRTLEDYKNKNNKSKYRG